MSAPTLIVWGEEDALVSVYYADEFAQRIPDSRVAVTPEAGDILQVEATEETLRQVLLLLGV